MAKYKINPGLKITHHYLPLHRKKGVKGMGFHRRNLYNKWNMILASQDQKLKSA